MAVIPGTNGDNSLRAANSSDVYDARGGNDIISAGLGNDVIYAGAGNDKLDGGGGDDALFGGTGSDIFIFRSAAEANGDLIYDYSWSEGDAINLYAIDADVTRGGNQDFREVITGTFSQPGQLRLSHHNGYSYLQANTDGSSDTDFTITFPGGASFGIEHIFG